MIEFGVAFASTPDVLHYGPMTDTEAETWIEEWENMGGPRDMFIMISREVSPWSPIDPC